MIGRICRVASVAVVLSAFVSLAAADAPPEVALEVPDCFGVKGADVQKLVVLELEPRMRVVAAGAPAALVGRVLCPDGARVELRVDDPERAQPLRSELDLARVAATARTRLLALALAELIATSRLESAGAGTETGPGSGAGTATGTEARTGTDSEAESGAEKESEGESEADARDGWLLWVGPALSLSFAPTTPLFGADIGASRALGPFAVQAELAARFGRAAVTDADVAMQNVSAALAVGPELALGAVDLVAGVGLRGGYARLSASATRSDRRGASVEGAFFGPIAMAAATVGVLGPSRLRIALEAGYTTRSVVGQDIRGEELVAMRGPWVGTTVALGLSL